MLQLVLVRKGPFWCHRSGPALVAEGVEPDRIYEDRASGAKDDRAAGHSSAIRAFWPQAGTEDEEAARVTGEGAQ